MSSLPYIVGFLCGLIAGLYYFYGLLITVRKVPVSRQPKRLLATSYLLRLLPVLVVMLFFARKDPGMFIALLIGFFMVRFIMIRKITRLTEEEAHAAQP